MFKVSKLYKTKEEAAAAMKESISAFYILIAILVFFGAFYLILDQKFLGTGALLEAGIFFVLVAVIHKFHSRIAAVVLSLFSLSPLVASIIFFSLSANVIMNLLFGVVIFSLAMRILLASFQLQARDTMSS